MPSTPSASQPQPGERHPPTRCILWRPGSAPSPPELLASLRKRGITITECTDAYAALAHTCRLEHAPPDRIILLLVSPSHLADAPEALDVVARYAPHVACWWYDSRTSEKLQRITPADIVGWTARTRASSPDEPPEPVAAAEQTPHLAPADGPRRAPALRLTSDADAAALRADLNGDGEHGFDADPDAAPLTPTTLLTNEELAMLLAEPPAAAAPGGISDPSSPAESAAAKAGRTPWWRRPDSGGER